MRSSLAAPNAEPELPAEKIKTDVLCTRTKTGPAESPLPKERQQTFALGYPSIPLLRPLRASWHPWSKTKKHPRKWAQPGSDIHHQTLTCGPASGSDVGPPGSRRARPGSGPEKNGVRFPQSTIAAPLSQTRVAGRHDGFLSILKADGTGPLIYSTYLGGNANNDVALGVTYNSGNVFVTGWAQSATFPITAGTYQAACASCNSSPLYSSDGFIIKFLDVFSAHDGFESGNYTGGSGDWTGGWTTGGDLSILTSSGQHSGTRHVRLRRNTGYLRRTINTAGMLTAKLGFWARVESFETADKAYVRVKSSGSTFALLHTFTPAASDNIYHYYEFDVTAFLTGSPLQVEFDAEMNATNDNWYVDDIRLVGTE